MYKFEDFNIWSIPYSLNSEAYMLANVASNLFPSNDFSHDKFSIEFIYRLSIPNNTMNWRIFECDEQIINVLHSKDIFMRSIIDDEHHEALLQASASENNPKYRNFIAKNIIRLEKLFDLQDKFKRLTNTKINNSSLRYGVVNHGTKKNPQNINLGTSFTHVKK